MGMEGEIVSRKGVNEIEWEPADDTITVQDIQKIRNSSEIQKFNINEESKMTRRVVKVLLIDEDKGLPVEDSIVAVFESVVTEDDDETTIREILMIEDVDILLETHNERRSNLIDEEILKRTGNAVKLRPVKLKDLKWHVK